MSRPPGPRLPALAQAVRLHRNPIGTLEACRRRYGDCFRLRIWPVGELVVVADPAVLADIFTGDPAVFRTGEATARVLPILGGSVLCADEAEHGLRRRRLLPAFDGHGLAAHAGWIARAASREIERWPLGRPVRLLPRLRSLAFAVIAHLVLGAEDEARLARLERGLGEFLAPPAILTTWLPRLQRELGRWSPWAVFERRRLALDELLAEEVRLRRRQRPGGDALSLLLGAGLSDGECCEELRALLIVGHETTAAALAWALERLARHPSVAERLVEATAAGDQRYADAVARETLRSRSPVIDAVRLLGRPVELCGFLLPAGTIVMAAPPLVHRRPELYPDPERFSPERFLEHQPPAQTVVPFGGGVRRCLGAPLAMLELKTVVPLVLERLRLRPDRPQPERSRLVGTAIVPARGARVVLERRASGPRS